MTMLQYDIINDNQMFLAAYAIEQWLPFHSPYPGRHGVTNQVSLWLHTENTGMQFANYRLDADKGADNHIITHD
jgi:hypothetical protein